MRLCVAIPNRALSSLARCVSAELARSGWKDRRLDDYGIATVTRDTRNGVMTPPYVVPVA